MGPLNEIRKIVGSLKGNISRTQKQEILELVEIAQTNMQKTGKNNDDNRQTHQVKTYAEVASEIHDQQEYTLLCRATDDNVTNAEREDII